MRKRIFIRIISFISAFAVFFAASGFMLQRSKAVYEDVLGKVRLSGLASLCEYVHDISMSLRLLAVSSDEKVSESASVAYAKILGAQGCIACFEDVKTENISAFLSGIASFSQGFSDNVISGEEREKALAYSDYAQDMYYHLSDVANAVVSGEYSLFEAGEIYSKNTAEFFENHLDFSNGAEKELFSGFESVSVQTRAMQKQKREITVREAKENAADFLSVHSSVLRDKDDEAINGLQTYKFTHNGISVNVCRYGGEICRFVDSHICMSNELTHHQAQEKAELMMKKAGCYEYELIVSQRNGNASFFIFVPVENNILLLDATVKIEVCAGEGRIVYFDAVNYCKYYPENVSEIPENADISSLLPDNLTFIKSNICYVTIDGKERYCHLVQCLLGDERVFVFIDCNSLKMLKTVFTG